MENSQGSSTPAAPEAIEASTEANVSNPDAELESLEQELDAQDNSEPSKSKEDSSAKSDSKTESKAAKAAKEVGAKKVDNQTYKIKVDGEEVEMSLEEITKFAQLGKAGQKRMAEAAQIKKEAGELIDLLRSDPEAVLSDPAILGSSEEVIKFAQKILARQLEDEMKSPEVREKEQLQKEVEALRKQMKEESEAKSKAEYERLVAQEEEKLQSEINEAIDSSGLPASPFVLKRISDVLIMAAENDKQISPKQAMNIVKKEMMKDIKELLGASPEDALEDLIGSDRIKSLRKKQLAKAKATSVETAAPRVDSMMKPVQRQELNSEKASPEKKVSMKDFLRGR